MRISVTAAKSQLDDLVRRAEAGEEIILTYRGRDAVRLNAVDTQSPEYRQKRIEAIQRSAAEKILSGPCAARSQDFLYDENGLPN